MLKCLSKGGGLLGDSPWMEGGEHNLSTLLCLAKFSRHHLFFSFYSLLFLFLFPSLPSFFSFLFFLFPFCDNHHLCTTPLLPSSQWVTSSGYVPLVVLDCYYLPEGILYTHLGPQFVYPVTQFLRPPPRNAPQSPGSGGQKVLCSWVL